MVGGGLMVVGLGGVLMAVVAFQQELEAMVTESTATSATTSLPGKMGQAMPGRWSG